jgi:hypothetical protein
MPCLLSHLLLLLTAPAAPVAATALAAVAAAAAVVLCSHTWHWSKQLQLVPKLPVALTCGSGNSVVG